MHPLAPVSSPTRVASEESSPIRTQGAKPLTGAVLRAVDPTGHFVGPTIEIDDYTASTISRDGDRIVAATRQGITVFDQDGEPMGTIADADLRIAFITVSDQLFVASPGGELVQYDMATLEPIRTFGGSRGAVQELFGTSDGSLIRRPGRGWTRLALRRRHRNRIGAPFAITPDDQFAMALSLDGATLAYGGGRNSAIRLVDLDPDTWVEAACRIAGRNLTTREWNTYLGDLAEYRTICQP